MGKLIQNINDVAEKCFGTEVERLEHDVYKYTVCGAWIKWDEDSVTIGSIVEGSDEEFCRIFEYPFDSDEIDNWIADLEKLCHEAWKKANMNELMVNFGISGYIYFRTERDKTSEAIEEFYNAMENAGINCDNLFLESYELRDPDGEIIEEE